MTNEKISLESLTAAPAVNWRLKTQPLFMKTYTPTLSVPTSRHCAAKVVASAFHAAQRQATQHRRAWLAHFVGVVLHCPLDTW